MCILKYPLWLQTFSQKSHEYQHDFNEKKFQKFKGEDNFFLRSSSLNDICLYLNKKKLGFTAGRCLILYALVRTYSTLENKIKTIFALKTEIICMVQIFPFINHIFDSECMLSNFQRKKLSKFLQTFSLIVSTIISLKNIFLFMKWFFKI